MLKRVVFFSILLAMVVIVLGAYTRLTDAGLGCPDWPGCYGHLTVPQEEHEVSAAEKAFPDRPVEEHKAWNEMVHRYFAGALGIFVLIIAIMSYSRRRDLGPVKLPFLLLLLVIFQAALGMWTVTMNLMPAVVMGHLLGGFTVLSLLVLLYLRLTRFRVPGGDFKVRGLAGAALLGLLILVVQIALGGWTSANYAALTCTQLPICEAGWYGKLDFNEAFSLPTGHDNYEYGVLDYGARMTIHIVHRVWAVVTFVYLMWLGVKIMSESISSFFKQTAMIMMLLLCVQVGLGVSNVVMSLPLTVAVAHNAVAACLLLSLVVLNYSIRRKA